MMKQPTKSKRNIIFLMGILTGTLVGMILYPVSAQVQDNNDKDAMLYLVSIYTDMVKTEIEKSVNQTLIEDKNQALNEVFEIEKKLEEAIKFP